MRIGRGVLASVSFFLLGLLPPRTKRKQSQCLNIRRSLGASLSLVAPIGDDAVLSYVQSGQGIFPGWGTNLSFVGGGDCPGSQCSSFELGSHNNAGTYSGPAATVFAIPWGGGGWDQPLLALKFAVALTALTISGFDHGVSFIRAYSAPADPSPTPLPGALWLMTTVLPGWVSASRWRRKDAISAVT